MTLRSVLLPAMVGLVLPMATAQLGARQRINRPLAPPAPPIFLKALGAMEKLRFSGERLVENDQGAIRKSHTEYVRQDGVNSRVWYPADSQFAGQVIVETAKGREHFYPGRNQIEILPPKKEQAFVRLRQWIERPGRVMRLTSMPGERVAGRPTEIGVVSDPKGSVRQRLWVDTVTGLILKREVLDNVGDRTLYFEYVQVDYTAKIVPKDFVIDVPSAKRITMDDKLRMIAGRNGMLVVSLAPSTGFTLEGVNMVKPTGVPVLHEAYSGPRGQLSLFQVVGNIDLHGLRPNNQRDLQIYGWQLNGHSFALVGNYAQDYLRLLAQDLGGP